MKWMLNPVWLLRFLQRINAPLSPGLPRFSDVFAIPRGLFGRYIHVRSASVSVMQYWSMMRSAGWNYSCLNSFHSHSDSRSLNCFGPLWLTGCCFCLLPHFVEIPRRVSKWCKLPKRIQAQCHSPSLCWTMSPHCLADSSEGTSARCVFNGCVSIEMHPVFLIIPDPTAWTLDCSTNLCHCSHAPSDAVQ